MWGVAFVENKTKDLSELYWVVDVVSNGSEAWYRYLMENERVILRRTGRVNNKTNAWS